MWATAKKILNWYSRYGKIQIEEASFRKGRRGEKFSPFRISAEVAQKSYSRPLQRIIADLAADDPFHKVPFKLKEHHGITAPVSTIRKITLQHGEQIGEYQQATRQKEMPDRPGVATVIAQADGTMVPIVETTPASQATQKRDRRKTRVLKWQEARLCLAHQAGSLEVSYAATMKGAEVTGQQMTDCAIRAGAGLQTHFHCIGDGAPWIFNQVEDQFGSQASYLIDFYHLCEYLEAAAKALPGDSQLWLATQKQRLRDGQIRQVLHSLQLLMEDCEVPDEQAPVRACHRYINNRPGQFNYKRAIEQDFPIGSGQVESSHRHVIQARLKRSGAWWTPENAQRMLNLRSLRANHDWDYYWSLLPLAA